ncbi:hypothetical protein [Herbiconiux liukaitaii]|uniref:hypothetical protein n=1 Tax=Herbiconiux liukaitaii TaxID=3342799 RepID=UPI0035B98185
MANDFSDDRPGTGSGGMTQDEARAALGELERDGGVLADRIVTPAWYHPILGLITAVLVGAQALPDAWPMIVIALAIVAIPVLTTTYTRRYGVAVSKPAGPRGRRLMLGLLAVLIAGMASTLALKLLGLEPWWALLPAAVTFLATVILGRRFDDALRQEITAPSERRP